jgi:hypothetical protein
MTQTTWDMVRAALERTHGLKHERGDQWRGASPFRTGSDGNAFVVRIAADGEHGTYIDHKDETYKGSLYQLAAHLNITPARRFERVTSTKRQYTTRKDYAEAHGVPDETLAEWYWGEIEPISGRPAMPFKTRGGLRFRFTDGQKPAFKSELGYKKCWYGLERAAKMALDKGTPLVFCNGEISVVAGQYWGLPATTITSGETGTFSSELLEQVKLHYNGKVVIALDCDFTGTNAAFGLVKAFQAIGVDAVAIDLGLGDGGDLADFCKLYTDQALARFQDCKPLEVRALPPEQLALPTGESFNIDDLYCSDIDALQAYIDELTGVVKPVAAPLINPFKFLHSQGGMGEIIPPGKLIYFASISGGTKTIGFETGWEAYQDMGIHSIVYTPEWVDKKQNAIELAARAVQRQGGAFFNDWQKHRLSQAEQEFNLKTTSGKPLSMNQVAASCNHASNLMRRPGRAFYIKNPGLSVEQLCATIDAICQRELRNGIRIQAVWIDFAQLLWLQNGTENGRVWIETAINKLKDVCRDNNLVGFVNSQMRKDDAELAKTGGKLEASMMQFLSDQQANFVFAFVPKFEDGKRVSYDDPHGRGKVGILTGRCLKNTMAELTGNEIEIPVLFSRLKWMDKDNSK